MNKAFEKIVERFDAKKQYFQKFYEADGKTKEDECINKATQLAFDDAKNIVQEVAEEYKIDMKHNLAEMYAKNMVDYGVDVTKEWQTATQQSYALEQAYIRGRQYEIDRFNELRKEYNNIWIPCSERLPEENQEVILQDFYGNITIEKMKTNDGVKGFSDGNWWSSANNYIAWQSLPEPKEHMNEDIQ